MFKSKKQKSLPRASRGGFTLIEILVTIAIIGLLASIIVIIASASKESSKVAKGLKYSDSIRAKLSTYEVAWLRFEESSTNCSPSANCIKDSWGGNSGTPTNVTFGQAGVGKGSAFEFNGTNSSVTLTSSITLTNTNTVSMWIYPKTPANGWGALFMDNTPGNGDGIYLRGSSAGSDNRKIDFWYSNNSHLNNTPLNNQTWSHVVVVNNAGAVTFYVNGQANGTAAVAPGYRANSIGNDSSSEAYKGLIDEVQIWSSALTAMEIQQRYAESAPRHNIALK